MTRKPCIVARNAEGINAACVYHGEHAQFWCRSGCAVARRLRPDAPHVMDAPPAVITTVTWMGARMRLKGWFR